MSFALVAGACCLIVFSKPIDTYKATLNINSTGAKYWGYRYAPINADSVRLVVTTSDINQFPGAPLPASLFVVYDGTYYMTFSGLGQFYNDYNDS